VGKDGFQCFRGVSFVFVLGLEVDGDVWVVDETDKTGSG
jgi:hypothetical protein